MDLGEFLARLQESGRVCVVADERGPALGRVQRVLAELDAAVRCDAADGLPPLDLAAATWAVALLYQGCVALIHRDLDEGAIARRLAPPCPSPVDAPSTHAAVDLGLRWLPDLFDLARGLASEDPLLDRLRRIARAWPLSSVGIAGVGDVDATPLLTLPALRLQYVDRILRRDDAARLADPRVARAVAAALGAQRQLAPPAVAAALAAPMETVHG